MRVGFTTVAIISLVPLWARSPRLIKPAHIESLTWWRVEDYEGRLVPWDLRGDEHRGISQVAPQVRGGRTYCVEAKTRKDWALLGVVGVPLMVSDSGSAVVFVESYLAPHSEARVVLAQWPLPGQAITGQEATGVTGAMRTALERFTDARTIPDSSYRTARLHWSGVRYLGRQTLRIAAGVAVLTIVALWAGLGRAAIRRLESLRRRCPHCAYDLTGLEGRPCPECGSAEGAHRFPAAASIIPGLAATYERE